MKSNLVKLNVCIAVLLTIGFIVSITHPRRQKAAIPRAEVSAPEISIYFSPHGGCTSAVVDALDAAKHSVRVQAYSFTSAPIAKALVDAKRRGVDVEILLDKSQHTEKYSSADFVAHAGISTFIDAVNAIAHNKVMVIDGETVLTGSCNFTKAAEDRNAENLLVIHGTALAEKYQKNWEAHRARFEDYSGK